MTLLAAVIGVLVGFLVRSAVSDEHAEPGWSGERVMAVTLAAMLSFLLGGLVAWGLTMG